MFWVVAADIGVNEWDFCRQSRYATVHQRDHFVVACCFAYKGFKYWRAIANRSPKKVCVDSKMPSKQASSPAMMFLAPFYSEPMPKLTYFFAVQSRDTHSILQARGDLWALRNRGLDRC